MNYYYDLLVNLDTELWEFYEWEEKDVLLPIKKIPFVRVSESDMRKFMQYEIQMDPIWLSKFEDKTIFKNQKEKSNCILFSSSKNSIVLEFDLYGNVIGGSKLLMEDENNCNEVALTLKESEVSYTLKEKREPRKKLRQEQREQHLFEVELNTIKETQNKEKCAYLYYEWFGKLEQDLDKMLKDFEEQLKLENTKKIHEIVKLIRLSYKETL